MRNVCQCPCPLPQVNSHNMEQALHELAKAVSKLGLKDSSELSARRQRDRFKFVEQAARIILAKPVSGSTDRQGHYVLRFSDDGQVDDSEDEACEVLYAFREMHLPVRNLYRLRRVCRRSTLDAMRKRLLPYRPRLVPFKPASGRQRAGSVVELQDLVQFRIRLALARGTVQLTRGCIWVVICFDATQVWKSGITRCDVYVDVHGSKAQARYHRNWSTWFIFDGPDDAAPLCIADREGKLTQMVQDQIGRAHV